MTYINLHQIADDLYENKLLQDIPYESIVKYAIKLMGLIGCPQMFEERVVECEVKDYRCLLPCDFVEIKQVKSSEGIMYRHTTDSFHMEHRENNGALTYKVQGNFIYTSNKNGYIKVAYQAIALDEEGFPLIPDNSSFHEALLAFIKERRYNDLLDEGKIPLASYQIAQQKYMWYVGQAQSSLVKLSLDQMENVTAIMNSLVLRMREHHTGFVNSGNREHINTH